MFEYREVELEDPCWKNYRQLGMKSKNGKLVPNCVPVGGKISTPDLKGLLHQSYNSKTPKDYKDYQVDKSLSGQRVQVYVKKGTNEVFVVHRGSQGIHDWGNDLKALAGYDISKSDRFKHAEKIQKQAEKKYGAKNVSTLGHSLAGKISSQVGKNSKEIINLNKFIPPQDILKKPSDKEYNIRSSIDPASVLLPLEKGKNTFTIPSQTFNPVAEHSTNILDRLPEDTMIGRGHLKKMKVKQIKDIIKKLPKNGEKFYLKGKKKNDLIDYCCLRCQIN